MYPTSALPYPPILWLLGGKLLISVFRAWLWVWTGRKCMLESRAGEWWRALKRGPWLRKVRGCDQEMLSSSRLSR